MQLTEKQNSIKERVINSKGKEIITMRGFAGTGKTITATEIIKNFLEDGKKVCVMAPTNTALDVLRSKLKEVQCKELNFKTVAKLATTPKEFVSFMDFKFAVDEEGMSDLRELLERLNCQNIDSIIRVEKRFWFNYATQENEETDVYKIDKFTLYANISKIFKHLTLDDIKVEVEFIYKEPNDIKKMLKPFDLVIIDEMPMVNDETTELIEDAMRLANNEDIKSEFASKDEEVNKKEFIDDYPTYLFVGDSAQLKPVVGDINKYMIMEPKNEENLVYELTDILRSTDEIAKMGDLIKKGVTPSAMVGVFPDHFVDTKLARDGLITHKKDDLVNSDVILTFTNAMVKFLNEKVRTLKGFNNSENVQVGEKIQVKNNSRIDDEVLFTKGEEYYINKIYSIEEAINLLEKGKEFELLRQHAKSNKSIDEEMKNVLMIIKISDYILVELKNEFHSKLAFISKDLKYENKSYNFEAYGRRIQNLATITGGLAPMVEASFGYARTIHMSQGSEWENVVVVLTGKDLWINKNKPELPYTAVTRAKNDMKMFILK